MTRPWITFETLYTARVRAAADAWLEAGTEPPEGLRAEQVGELVLLRTMADRGLSDAERAERVARVGAELVGPRSDLRDVLDDDARVVEEIRARHHLGSLEERSRPAPSQAAVLGEPVSWGVHPGWQVLSMVLLCSAAVVVGLVLGSDGRWQLSAFVLAGGWALVCTYGIARRVGTRVDRSGIHVRGFFGSRSYGWSDVRDVRIDVSTQDSPMGPTQTRAIVLTVGAEDAYVYSHARHRLPVYVRGTREVRDELVAYGDASGARFSEVPALPVNSYWPAVRMMAGIPIAATVAIVASEWGR